MKILVTGANGYLGQGIVKELLDNGNDVIAVDFTTDFVDKRAKLIATDLFNVENPFEEFGQPDALLHLAWRDGFVHNSSNHINDLPAHFNFIQKMINSGIKSISVMGTMHEIGFYEGCIDENTPCNPLNLYGIAKNALRNAVFLIAKDSSVNVKWLRGYYIVGNSKFGNSIFSKITSAASEGKDEFPFTTGKNKYDFINYEDFAVQVAAAATQSEVDGIINICSGKPVSLADRVEQFITENDYKIKLKYGAFPDRAYDSDAVWGNSEKIMKILKLKGE